MRSKQLILLWESAHWADLDRLMKAGNLPHFKQLCEQGAAGKLTSVEPVSAATGAISLATGLPACDHGVFGMLKANEHSVEEVISTDWQPLWNLLNQDGSRCVIVNWPMTHPAPNNNNLTISDRYSWTGRHQYRFCTPSDSVSSNIPDELTTELNRSRIQPSELGNDVLADFLDIPEAELEASAEKEKLRLLIAQIYTIHAATLTALTNTDWDLGFVTHSALLDIIPLIKSNGLEPKHRDKVYTILDQLLGVLQQQLPEDLTIHILSSHGHTSGDIKTAHPTGVWAMQGANVVSNRLILGAHVLDIAPTVLRIRGEVLPDLPHQARTDLLTDLPPLAPRETQLPPASIPSQTVAKKPWAHLQDDGRVCRILSPQRRFDPNLLKRVKLRTIEGRLNSLSQQLRFTEACAASKQLYQNDPSNPRTAINYGYCLLAESKHEQLSTLLDETRTLDPSVSYQTEHQILNIRSRLQTADKAELSSELRHLGSKSDTPPAALLKIAGVYRDLGQLESAIEIYHSLVQSDTDWIAPRMMLAVALLKQRSYAEAEQAAEEVLARDITRERAQYTVAMARLRQGKKEEARNGLLQFMHMTGGTRLIRRVFNACQA